MFLYRLKNAWNFVLGRCFGALLGGMAYSEYPDNFKDVHEGFTIAAAVVAILYFIAYHFYLKQKCAAPLHLPPDPAPAVIQSKYFKQNCRIFYCKKASW